MTRLPFPYLTENKSCQNAVSSIPPTGVLVSDWAPRTRREVFCLGACLIFDNPPPAGHTKNDRRSTPKIGFVRSFFMRLPSRDPCTKAHTPHNPTARITKRTQFVPYLQQTPPERHKNAYTPEEGSPCRPL